MSIPAISTPRITTSDRSHSTNRAPRKSRSTNWTARAQPRAQFKEPPASQYLSTTHDWGIKLPLVVMLLVFWFIVTATSNGANSLMEMGFFKLTKRLTGTGRRIFRIAPIHHHFEHLGWEEVTVVIRIWIIGGIFVATGLGIFYASWLA